ncbi:MAG: hypothetical protein ACK4Q5_14470 [Saprospiraceae bacterium]
MDTAAATSIYQEFAEFLAMLAPERVLAFRPSERQQNRLSHLLEAKKTGALSPSQESELEHFFTLERIMRLAKAKALTLIVNEPAYS